MLSNNLVGVLFVRIAAFILDYITYFPYTFFIIEIFAIALMIVTNTGLETVFIQLISYTPTLNYDGRSSFQMGTNEVLQFMTFWSFVLLIVSKVLKKITSFSINMPTLFVIFSIYHLIALIRLWNIPDMSSIVVFFYVASILNFVMYRVGQFVKNYFLKIINYQLSKD